MSTNVEVSRAFERPLSERGSNLLALTEGQWFDRKASKISALKLADFEVGFANADGGTIVLGLHDGNVQGFRSMAEHENELRQAAINHTEPPVRAHCTKLPCLNDQGEEDYLLVIEVEPSEIVHANRKDEVFLRVGDENRKLNFKSRQELLYDKGQATFESSPVADAGLEDLDPEETAMYADALGHGDVDRVLSARGLINHKKELTAAAILLFGKVPTLRFPEAYVRVLRYMGSERGSGRQQGLAEDLKFEGPIPRILVEATERIRQMQPTRRALGENSLFTHIPLIPEDAWIEGLVNAAIHRSYSLGGDHIRFEIFSERMEIESPGRFPGLISWRDPLKATRFARNPRIARVCSDLNFGQELGEGIRRMFDEMRRAGLADPLYDETSGSVRLTLLAMPVDRELAKSLPRGSQQVVALLRRFGPLGTGEIAEYLAISRPTVLRRLRALQKAGVVEWSGRSTRDPRALWGIADR